MKQLPKEYILQTVTNVDMRPDSNLANKTAQKQIINVVVKPNSNDVDQQTATYNVGTLTGATATAIDGRNAIQFIYNNKTYWTTTDGLQLTGSKQKYYQQQATDKAKILIADNKQVFEDLLLASEFIRRLEQKGYNCNSYRSEVKQLYQRFETRQNYLIAYSDSDTYEEPQLLSSALSNIVNGQSIGIAVSTIVISSIVVTAICSSLAWYIFYTYSSEAKSDCRKSKQLNKILANVDPQTREELYKYIDNYADSFYKKAVIRTKTSDLLGNIKTVGLIALGGYGFYYLTNKLK